MEETQLLLALGRAPGLTAQHLRQALQYLGAQAPQALAGMARSQLEALGLPPHAALALSQPGLRQLDADRCCLNSLGITLLAATDPRYPAPLAAIPGAPALLYVRGRVELLGAPQLAMVGSRQPTPLGIDTATDFARRLAEAGLTVTSGLALGIDAASHQGALTAAPAGGTIAVLGCGIDRPYPPQNRALAQRIARSGALVSEFPPGTPPLPANFPRRNRLISGLSAAVLVVEAARHSGSFSTARHALDQGREVFAIPGSIHNPMAQGCHALIKAGARLVESTDEILLEIRNFFPKHNLIINPANPECPDFAGQPLDKAQKILLDALGFEPTSIDTLVERTGLPSQTLASMLLILELEGGVGVQDAGRYMRLRRPHRSAWRP